MFRDLSRVIIHNSHVTINNDVYVLADVTDMDSSAGKVDNMFNQFPFPKEKVQINCEELLLNTVVYETNCFQIMSFNATNCRTTIHIDQGRPQLNLNE